MKTLLKKIIKYIKRRLYGPACPVAQEMKDARRQESVSRAGQTKQI
jgi:hypothetical protein